MADSVEQRLTQILAQIPTDLDAAFVGILRELILLQSTRLTDIDARLTSLELSMANKLDEILKRLPLAPG